MRCFKDALSMRTWAQATPDCLEYWFLLREPQAGLPAKVAVRDLAAPEIGLRGVH